MTTNIPHELPLAQPGGLESLSEKTLVDRAKTALLSAVVTAEVLPVTNEGSRFGALAATEVMTHNPLIGAAVLGGSTLLVEGAGALAASEILTGNTSNRILNWVNSKIEKWVPEDATMSKPVEAGVAMTLGTSITMAAVQRQNPDRSKEEARKHGLITAAWMAGVFAVEGAMISEGIDNYANPTVVGAALITTGGLFAIPKWVKNSIKKREATAETVGAQEESQLPSSTAEYEAYRDRHDEAVKIGLYGRDLEAALEDTRTITLPASETSSEMPLLVPLDRLEWYNIPYLQSVYGAETPLYYFAHPPIRDGQTRQSAAEVIGEQLEGGAVIITDEYVGTQGADDTLEGLIANKAGYQVDELGGEEVPKIAHVFAAEANIGEAARLDGPAPDVYDVYDSMVQRGEADDDPANGISLVRAIEGDEADKIWQLYRKPFERLSENHPVLAGFDEESLLDLLKDPSMLKVVNRVDGDITTICLVTQNFDLCPWFNKTFYDQKYPEYAEKDNILLFPSIVSDEEKRGNSYSLDLINFLGRLYRARGENMLISFECTEISAQYIPKIVEIALGTDGVAQTSGLEAPISTTQYRAIRKS